MTFTKRLLALFLSLALLSAGHIHVFSTSTDLASPTTHTAFSISETAVNKTQDTVTISAFYETTHVITNGVLHIEFPADKLELVDKDNINALVKAFPFAEGSWCAINNLEADKGKLTMAFAFVNRVYEASGVLATLTFRILDRSVLGEDAITISTNEWCNEDSVNLAEDEPLVAIGRLCETFVSDDGFEYIFINDDTQAKIVGYVGTSKNPTIPESLEGKSVTAIGDQAFTDASHIQTLTVPMSVTTIYPDAFLGCYFTYRAPVGSAMQQHAKENNFQFVPLLPDGVQLGDVNGDVKINTSDARTVLQYAAGKIDLSDMQLSAADVTLDSKVNTSDARRILQYAAGMILSFTP